MAAFDIGRGPRPRREGDVAALDIGLDVVEAELVADRAEVAHRDLVLPTDVDPPEEGDEASHRFSLSWDRHLFGGRKPASRSAMMSSIDSRPTDRRTRPGSTPVVSCSARLSWRVGGRGRVDGEAAHVADVGHVAVQRRAPRRSAGPASMPPLMMNAGTEPSPGRRRSFSARSYHGESAGRRTGPHSTCGVAGEVLGDRLGVRVVALHAQAQRLEALQEQERVERRDRARRCRAAAARGP